MFASGSLNTICRIGYKINGLGIPVMLLFLGALVERLHTNYLRVECYLPSINAMIDHNTLERSGEGSLQTAESSSLDFYD